MNIITAFSSSTLQYQFPIPPRASLQRATLSLPKTRHRQQLALSAMSSSPPTFTELNSDSDFSSLLSPNDHISICGFGSLLSGMLTSFILSSSSSSSLNVFSELQNEAPEAHFLIWSISEPRNWITFVVFSLMLLLFSLNVALRSQKLWFVNCYLLACIHCSTDTFDKKKKKTCLRYPVSWYLHMWLHWIMSLTPVSVLHCR